MPTHLPPGYAEVVHSISLAGDPEPMAITYGIDMGDFLTQAQVDDLHDAFGDYVTARMFSGYSMTTTEIRANNVDAGPDQDPVVWTKAVTYTGGGADQPLPQNTAMLVHKRTARGGRRGRGRLYMPSIPEAACDATGLLTSVHQTSTQTALNTWLARFGTGPLVGITMCLLHQYKPDVTPDPIVLAPDPITSLQLDPRVATQRRRLRR